MLFFFREKLYVNYRSAIIHPSDSHLLSAVRDRVSHSDEQEQSLRSGATALDSVSSIIFVYL